MSVPARTDKHNLERPTRGLLLIFIILFIALLCAPAAAATRDVKVALTELRPTLFTDDHGEPAGFFVDIIEEIARREGWNVIWVRGTLAESWDRLSSGDIDMLPGVANTTERAAHYDFSHESALAVWSQVYARHGSGIGTILDLDGKRIVMVKGDRSGIAFKDYAEKFGVNATYLERDTPNELFSATAAGEADALVVFNMMGREDAITYDLAATPVMFDPTRFGFAVRKGENKDLLLAIDTYLAREKDNPSSTYGIAMEKWFGIEPSPVIPIWLLWGLGTVAFIAVLFITMSYILRRQVQKKTAELSLQNKELAQEVANRRRAEDELRRKNEELNAAYEEMAATGEELRHNYQEQKKIELALMQARKKLNLLNALTFDEIRNAVFSVRGFIGLAKNDPAGIKTAAYLDRSEKILLTVMSEMESAKKFQDLGIQKPRWQNANIAFLNAISHLDFSRITRTADLEGLEIYADPLLEDVFFILMKNVLTHGKGATEVRIWHEKGPGNLTIVIEDNGPGIPEPEKEKIFGQDANVRGSRSLFLAREILAITEIAIRETGRPGTGARFEVIIPEGGYRIREKNSGDQLSR